MNYRPQKIKKGIQNNTVAPMISIGKVNTCHIPDGSMAVS